MLPIENKYFNIKNHNNTDLYQQTQQRKKFITEYETFARNALEYEILNR